MFRRARVRPSKPMSLLGMLVGIGFIILGVVIVIPNAGLFGLIWVLAAIGITLYHAYNFFSDRGVALYEADVDTAERIRVRRTTSTRSSASSPSSERTA